ncbi:MAG: hypothetical protein WCE50_05410 [Candidatus Acidiferrum sp.]
MELTRSGCPSEMLAALRLAWFYGRPQQKVVGRRPSELGENMPTGTLAEHEDAKTLETLVELDAG